MTPTPEQLAAVLPRCSAGLDGGDWTDDDERLDWARRVLRYVEAASRQNTEEDIQATIDWLRSLRESPDSAPGSPESDANADQVPQDPGNDSGETTGLSRDPHDVRHGDTWEARDDRATIVASNDWPPPEPPPPPNSGEIIGGVWSRSR